MIQSINAEVISTARGLRPGDSPGILRGRGAIRFMAGNFARSFRPNATRRLGDLRPVDILLRLA
jgi:hypothetical protein